MTHLQDVGWVLLIGLLLPVLILVGLAGLAFVVVRHLYLWARGNTTARSRPPRRRRRSVVAPTTAPAPSRT